MIQFKLHKRGGNSLEQNVIYAASFLARDVEYMDIGTALKMLCQIKLDFQGGYRGDPDRVGIGLGWWGVRQCIRIYRVGYGTSAILYSQEWPLLVEQPPKPGKAKTKAKASPNQPKPAAAPQPKPAAAPQPETEPVVATLDEDLPWWETLGVPYSASNTAIRQAWLSKAKLHHPDVGGEAENFKIINNAWQQAKLAKNIH